MEDMVKILRKLETNAIPDTIDKAHKYETLYA